VFEALNLSSEQEKFQIQTNGLGSPEFYLDLCGYKNKIDRIGFTCHSTVMTDTQMEIFSANVQFVKRSGIPVYIKEILFPEHKEEILKRKKFWGSIGIEFRLQDFKATDTINGIEYTDDEWGLIHPEYIHEGSECSCRKDRKQLIIRGYDFFTGDVIGCWMSPHAIGSITQDWYNPDYRVCIKGDGWMSRQTEINGKMILRPKAWKRWPVTNNLNQKGNSQMSTESSSRAESKVFTIEEALNDLKIQLDAAVRDQEVATIRRYKIEGAIEVLRSLNHKEGKDGSL
jgi:hypothetical protein